MKIGLPNLDFLSLFSGEESSETSSVPSFFLPVPLEAFERTPADGSSNPGTTNFDFSGEGADGLGGGGVCGFWIGS